MTEVVTVAVEQATPHALADFGLVIGRTADVPAIPIGFYKGAVKVSNPAPFSSDHPVDLSLTSLDRRPGKVRFMERY